MSAQDNRVAARLSGPDLAAIVIGVILLAMAGVVANDAVHLRSLPVYGIGPKASPYLVAALLALFGLGHLVTAFRGGLPTPDRVDWRAVGLVLGGLLTMIVSIWVKGGFIIPAAIIFAATARAFGSRRTLIDLALGALLAVTFYLIFVRLLGLTLPQGPLEHLL